MNAERWKLVDDLLQSALEIAPEHRNEFLQQACAGDSALVNEIRSLLTSYRKAEDFLQTPAMAVVARADAAQEEAFPDSLVGQVISHYRVLKMIGSGGMGSVWLAERCDGRFERQVAIKFIHSAALGQGGAERFQREGKILARLADPRIAEMIDAGVSARGEAYLVLEYVEGQSIDDYCDEYRLDIEARIRLFLEVLTAVAHAHSNLIVHRDIKPSNVLVRNDGQVKLLDFGIAKLLADEVEGSSPTILTLEGGSVLTPLFAAPEQVADGAVTTATDVYALGVLLYLLLTGRHPAGPGPHSPAEVMKAVLETEPAHASASLTSESAERRGTTSEKLSRQLRGDLDTILNKALKKNPSERYISVTAFADDLRRYLKHEPISARPDTLAYRTTRFVRRNFALVILTVSAIALVIASLSTGLYFVNRERKIAEQRFAQVRQLANKFIDLDSTIRGIPGTTRLRMQMVTDSLQYLSSLNTEAHLDNDLALEVGYAYVRVAHAQGDVTSPNLGQFTEAEGSLNNAQRFVDPVLAQDPKNQRALNIATTIAHDRMVLADTLGRPEEELSQARKTASLIERFMSLGSADPGNTYGMAYFYGNVANAFVNTRRLDDAIRSAQRGLEISSRFPSTRVAQPSLRHNLAYSFFEIADFDSALKIANQALSAQEEQAATGKPALRMNLANALCLRGEILGRADAEPSLSRPNEALPDFQRALDIAEDLSSKDASDYFGRHHVAMFGFEIGNTFRHSDPEKALTVYDHALARIREAKSNASGQRDEAELLAGSSYPLRWTGHPAEARQRIEKALDLLHKAGLYPADKIEPMSDVYNALRAHADDFAETGESAKAIEAYKELLAKMLAWKPYPQNDLRDATCLARTWSALADLLHHSGQAAEAKQFEAQRTELWNHWQDKLPNAQFVLRQSLNQITAPPGFRRVRR